jgi:DNA-3-methyladenine glycosylase II
VAATDLSDAIDAASLTRAVSAAAAPVVLRVEVTPSGPFALPGLALDGLMRRRDGGLARLLHHGEQPVVVRVAQSGDRVILAATARTRPAAEHGLRRMRFALSVDDDLSEFRRRFARDPLIGASVRRRPWLRVWRRPDPFEALTFAVCGQLIEAERAAAIERRIIARLGRRCPDTGLRDLPAASALARVAPARLQSFDLSGGRSLALLRAAREVASGRLDLFARDLQRGWRRLLAIPGIGRWTVETLALHGQGRYDQLPAGDLIYLRLVGRLLSGGDPHARASEEEVRRFFAPYGEWVGLAAAHLLGAAAARSPARAGTRS